MFWGYQAHFGTQKNYATGTKVDLNSNPAYFFLKIDLQLKQVVVPQCKFMKTNNYIV